VVELSRYRRSSKGLPRRKKEARYARYSPPDRYPPPPRAGMCLSSFAVMKKRDRVLVGIPKRHRYWAVKWVPQWSIYPKEEMDDVFDKQSRLPSTYLLEGEHPEEALRRLLLEQLGIEKFGRTSLQVLSFSSPSDWYPGESHWDLVFVYTIVEWEPPKKNLPWWKEISLLSKKDLRKREFGWNEDMMKELRLV